MSKKSAENSFRSIGFSLKCLAIKFLVKNLFLLIFGALGVFQSAATQVTNFTGTYSNGQVFFTWTNISVTNATYKLYRSTSEIIKGSQLSSSEYLGFTIQTSALNNNLSNH